MDDDADVTANLSASDGPIAGPNWASIAGNSAPDALLVVDVAGIVRWASPSTERVLRWAPDELVGQAVDVLVPVPTRSTHSSLRASFTADSHSRPMGAGRTFEALRFDGTTVAVEVGLNHLELDGAQYVLAAVRDRTEHLLIERELSLARTELARSDERARVARDLHDTVSQDLYGLGLAIQRAQRRGVATGDLDGFVGQVDTAIKQLASVIFELREIAGSGWFVDQVRHVVAMSARALGFAPSLDIAGELTKVPRAVGTHLVFVLRELLSNCAKHADASAVDVRVLATDTDVSLLVTDNGVGLRRSLDEIEEHSPGYGLAGIMGRARACQGRFSWSVPAAGIGTAMEWIVPLDVAAPFRR